MPDVERFQMPVEAGLELRAVIGLDDENAERKPPQHLIDEANGRGLVAGVVDLQHADPGAIIDGGELIQALLGARDPLEELHVQLQAMSRLGLLVALPSPPMWPALLIGGQTVQSVTDQDAVDGGAGDLQLVKSLQIVFDSSGAKVIALP